MANSYQPVDWFPSFMEGKREGFTHFLTRLYPILYRRAFKIIHKEIPAMNISFNAYGNCWQQRDNLNLRDPEDLEGLARSITEDDSRKFVRLQMRSAYPPKGKGNNEETIPLIGKTRGHYNTDDIYKTILLLGSSQMDKIADKDKILIHQLFTDRKTNAQLAREQDTTEAAISVQKSRAISSLYEGFGKTGLLSCLLLLLSNLL